MTTANDTYEAALLLVAQIDENLTRSTAHYRNKDGVLLLTLDEVVHAILNGELMTDETNNNSTGQHAITEEQQADHSSWEVHQGDPLESLRGVERRAALPVEVI